MTNAKPILFYIKLVRLFLKTLCTELSLQTVDKIRLPRLVCMHSEMLSLRLLPPSGMTHFRAIWINISRVHALILVVNANRKRGKGSNPSYQMTSQPASASDGRVVMALLWTLTTASDVMVSCVSWRFKWKKLGGKLRVWSRLSGITASGTTERWDRR